MMVFWQNLADEVAYYIGIEYPPALFLAVALVFVLIMLFHFAIEISILKENNKILIQEISIYKHILIDIKDYLHKKSKIENQNDQ
jgi:hypothetical protein